jgi:predicted nucleic acid-binding protein
MNVIDSSAWLEFFADAANAKVFAKPIRDFEQLIVPSICLYEVFKRVLQQRSENEALQAVAFMHQGKVVDLDADLALSAARLGCELKLPMADSIILATARRYEAIVWTQDADFEGLKGVKYFSKQAGKQ